MKIAFVVSQYPLLTETFIAREIAQMKELGHEVILCILRPRAAAGCPGGLQVPGLQCLRVGLSPRSFLRALHTGLQGRPCRLRELALTLAGSCLRKPSRAVHLLYLFSAALWLAEALRREGVEYIHAHFLHSEAVTAWLLSKMLALPFGLTSHVISLRHDRRLIRRVASDAAVLVADTRQAADFLEQLSGKPVALVHNGVDVAAYNAGSVDHDFGSHKPPLLLAVGSLVHAKGFHVLIRACGLLHSRGVPFRCQIIGEGNQRRLLAALIRKMALQERVSLPGSLPFESLRQAYKEAGILVMPSIVSRQGSDGLPTVIIEAMASGLPVVASRHAGIPDLVRAGETGLLAAPGDAHDLAECIQVLLSDSSLRNSLRESGRRLVQAEYDLKVNVAMLMEIIQSSLQAGGSR